MCGRYTQTKDLQVLEIRFGFTAPGTTLKPRFNVAPLQYAPVVLLEDGARRLRLMRWGLVPFWAKDEALAGRLINARGETLADKPSFKQAFAQRRCIVLADGFYEWLERGKHKQPYYFYLRSGQPFGIAGVYERRTLPDGTELWTFTVITTQPNELVASVHDRMPVLLPAEAEARWLDPATPVAELAELLAPCPAEYLTAHAVAETVNNVRNDSAECVEPELMDSHADEVPPDPAAHQPRLPLG